LSVSALPKERKQTKYCILSHWYYCLIKNTQNTHFVHIFIVLADSLSFLTVYKMFEMLAHEHGLETLSPFVDSSVDNVLLRTNSDFTSRFLNSSVFLNVRPI